MGSWRFHRAAPAALAALLLSCGDDGLSPQLVNTGADIFVWEWVAPAHQGVLLRRLAYGGSAEHTLLLDSTIFSLTNILSSPDGAGILFRRSTFIAGDGPVERLALKGSLPALTPHGTPVAWSPDGTHLLWTAFAGAGTMIMASDANGAGLDSLALGNAPVWSFDGSRVYFVYQPTNTDDEVGTVPLVGSHTRINLTNDPSTDFLPRPSPDGRFVAFETGRQPGDGTYLMTPSGTQPHRIYAGANMPADAWSPSSRYLAVTNQVAFLQDPHDEIVVLDTAGAVHATIRFPLSSLGSVAWAPAADVLLVVARPDVNSPLLQAFLFSADGRTHGQITHDAGGIGGAVWVKQ